MVFHQVLYTTDLRHVILLVRRNVFLNVPYGLSYCRLRIIEESKEYGVCNAKYDDQYTAKDSEER